ncbi:MAG: RNA polymerase sigma factor [Brevundimonas sp.]|uniref:RNA polymerase sigma factor n=1 Tax=Brevundimonas sp. TaxID=1871086 RepID=UPI00391BBFF1
MTDTKPLEPDASEGLNRLYRLYSGWLDRRLRAHLRAEDAADVVQETYLRLAPYRHADIRHPKSLILKIALNLVRDQHRRNALRDRIAQLPPAAPATGAPQLDVLAFRQMLASMPVLYRDVFVMSRFSGMTHGEIAARLGVSIKTVEWRMSKALEFCASQLDA